MSVPTHGSVRFSVNMRSKSPSLKLKKKKSSKFLAKVGAAGKIFSVIESRSSLTDPKNMQVQMYRDLYRYLRKYNYNWRKVRTRLWMFWL